MPGARMSRASRWISPIRAPEGNECLVIGLTMTSAQDGLCPGEDLSGGKGVPLRLRPAGCLQQVPH